jgi:hypothetical protein
MNSMDFSQFPICRRCGEGELVPLSDFGGQGAAVQYKAWVCTNPTCGFNLKIRNGEVFINEPVTDVAGAPQTHNSHAPQRTPFRSVR